MATGKRENSSGLVIGGVKIAGAAVAAVGSLARFVGSNLRLPGMARAHRSAPVQPGARPGFESVAGQDQPPAPGTIRIHCCDYSPERIDERDIDDLPAFLGEARPDWVQVRWINIDGLHPFVIRQFKDAFGFHTLAAEDAFHTPQRPKAESYERHLFVVARMLRMIDGALDDEQVSFFLQPGLLVTFQQHFGDVWEPVRQRIRAEDSRLRNLGVGYLAYALLDAIVDHGFPILEEYGELLTAMETQVIDDPRPPLLQRIHAIKRDMTILRRVMWPTREVLSRLQVGNEELFSDTAKTYMRDVYEHAVQIIDLIETFREMAGSLTDLYMSSISNRMNDVMKTLTLVATIFIPITFLAGIYGMNFEHIPELKWRWAYPAFWTACAAVAGGMLYYFQRKGWFGR